MTDLPCGVFGLVGFEDAFPLVGQKAHSEKQDMEVSSPIKPIADQREEKGTTLEITGQSSEGKTKATSQWKRLAREKGKNKSPGKDAKFISSGSKRDGKLTFEEGKLVAPQKKLRIANEEDLTQNVERSAVAARHHRQEP